MKCPKCGKQMSPNFTSRSCDNCDGEPESIFYTGDTLASLSKMLDLPKSRKRNIDTQHSRIVTPSYGDVDEIDREILIPYFLERIANITIDVTCEDYNYKDWKWGWEVLDHGQNSNKPKIRVYIYGDQDFLHNYVYFDIQVMIKLKSID